MNTMFFYTEQTET